MIEDHSKDYQRRLPDGRWERRDGSTMTTSWRPKDPYRHIGVVSDLTVDGDASTFAEHMLQAELTSKGLWVDWRPAASLVRLRTLTEAPELPQLRKHIVDREDDEGRSLTVTDLPLAEALEILHTEEPRHWPDWFRIGSFWRTPEQMTRQTDPATWRTPKQYLWTIEWHEGSGT